MFSITLPYPPSLNHYWRRVGSKTLISRLGRKYREEAVWLCRRQVLSIGKELFPLSGPLSLELIWTPPDNRERDFDNLLKAPLDALQHAEIYQSDSQIHRALIDKAPAHPGGQIAITISVLKRQSGLCFVKRIGRFRRKGKI